MTSPGCNVNVCYLPEYVREEVISTHAIIERTVWGNRAPDYSRMAADWNYTDIAVHHIGDALSRTPQAVEEKHMGSNGWDDVGYHYLIHPNGTFYEGRRLGLKGAHIAGANTGKIGILMIGDFDHQWWDRDDTLTQSHLSNLRALIRTLRSYFCIDTLGGHSEFPGQGDGCPGSELLPKVEEIRSDLSLSSP